MAIVAGLVWFRLARTGAEGELRVLAGTERTGRRRDARRERLGDDPGAWLEAFVDGKAAA